MKFCLPIRKIKLNPYDSLDEKLPFTVLGPNSPLSYQQAARRLAEDFANGTCFESAPYEVKEIERYASTDWRDRVLLFGKPTGDGKMRFFGAVGMRWKKYDDLPE